MATLTKIQLRQVKKAQELSNQLANLAKEISVDRQFPAHIADTFRLQSEAVSRVASTMTANNSGANYDRHTI